MIFGEKVRFTNTAIDNWTFGFFESYVSGGSISASTNSDGGDKIYCCRNQMGSLDRFQFCEKYNWPNTINEGADK